MPPLYSNLSCYAWAEIKTAVKRAAILDDSPETVAQAERICAEITRHLRTAPRVFGVLANVDVYLSIPHMEVGPLVADLTTFFMRREAPHNVLVQLERLQGRVLPLFPVP